jgi:hypothetical protein
MLSEIISIKLPDPDVLDAKNAAIKLFQEYRACTDTLVKKVFKEMVFDAFEYEAKLKLRSRAREAVEILHNLQKPGISEN